MEWGCRRPWWRQCGQVEGHQEGVHSAALPVAISVPSTQVRGGAMCHRDAPVQPTPYQLFSNVNATLASEPTISTNLSRAGRKKRGRINKLDPLQFTIKLGNRDIQI